MLGSAISYAMDDVVQQQMAAFKGRCEEIQRKQPPPPPPQPPQPQPQRQSPPQPPQPQRTVEAPSLQRAVVDDEDGSKSGAEAELALIEGVLRESYSAVGTDETAGRGLCEAEFGKACRELAELHLNGYSTPEGEARRAGFATLVDNAALQRAVYSALEILVKDSRGAPLPLRHVSHCVYVLVSAPPAKRVKVWCLLVGWVVGWLVGWLPACLV